MLETGTFRECFPVSAICKECIIVILMRDGTAYMTLVTSIAEIRNPLNSVAAIHYKILAVMVGLRA